MTDLRVVVDDHELAATWADGNPETRAAVADALPIAGDAARWGDELYVETDVDVRAEETRTAVPVGTVAYWPQGNAICVFWGPTPASRGDEPRAASPVAVVAELRDATPLEGVEGGASLRIVSHGGDQE